jgi:hypothetical protein
MNVKIHAQNTSLSERLFSNAVSDTPFFGGRFGKRRFGGAPVPRVGLQRRGTAMYFGSDALNSTLRRCYRIEGAVPLAIVRARPARQTLALIAESTLPNVYSSLGPLSPPVLVCVIAHGCPVLNVSGRAQSSVAHSEPLLCER